MSKSLFNKAGFASVDHIVERIENQYWKIEIHDFQMWMLGFYKFVGEWQTTELEPNKVLIEYTYTMYSESSWLYPITWLFAKLFWTQYMKHVLDNVHQLALEKEPYLYP